MDPKKQRGFDRRGVFSCMGAIALQRLISLVEIEAVVVANKGRGRLVEAAAPGLSSNFPGRRKRDGSRPGKD